MSLAVKLCIVQPSLDAITETFIAAHARRLPAQVTIVYGTTLPHIGEKPVLSQSLTNRFQRKIHRMMTRKGWEWEVTAGYLAAFRHIRAEAVLAEYGPTGVRIMEACRLARTPLIVHFHGFDASVRQVLNEHSENYRRLFNQAEAIIVVSRQMEQKIISLGAPAEKIHYNPYGVDCEHFEEGRPGEADPRFLAVGRFVEKKAPHLTLLAFAEVYRQFPEARLRMIGEGPLLPICQDLAKALEIEKAVTFLGAKPQDVVQMEMRKARAFVQHSVQASDGDCEGMPVAILEAGATGLPVVSTRHAGIPDAVIEGKTGFLVDERDVNGMARRMLQLAKNPLLAEKIGQAASARIRDDFSMQKSINHLWSIIKNSVSNSTI